MKPRCGRVTIVGGAGVRTPLLAAGLAARGLGIDEIVLFDTDADRLDLTLDLARRLTSELPIRAETSLGAAARGASFILTSIRPGGIEARAKDEATALSHGFLPQETVGPAGFAMAMRTVPAMIEIAQTVHRIAPDAWMINFTNPVGIVTQAVRAAVPVKIVGICDTPLELFHETAHVLGLPPDECFFDYVGLNHLGWLREVLHRGRPCLAPLFADASMLRHVYRANLFSPGYLADLRLLPSEYLYYYVRTAEATAHVRASCITRGGAIAAQNAQLWTDLARAKDRSADPVPLYRDYLANRNATYFAVESGSAHPLPPTFAQTLTGYDRVAADVMHAIASGSGAILPLNVTNDGNLSDFDRSDVVEIPCSVGRNGPRPLFVDAFPEAVRPLAVTVKTYERLAIEAALSRSGRAAEEALGCHPVLAGALPSAVRALANDLLLDEDARH